MRGAAGRQVPRHNCRPCSTLHQARHSLVLYRAATTAAVETVGKREGAAAGGVKQFSAMFTFKPPLRLPFETFTASPANLTTSPDQGRLGQLQTSGPEYIKSEAKEQHDER